MATAAPALSDDALAEMLSLMKGAGSVELKLTIPESVQRSTVLALGMDPLGAQVRLAPPTRPKGSGSRRDIEIGGAQGARVVVQAVAPHLTNMCRWNAFGQPVAVDAGARRHDPAACARSRRYSGCVAQ
jgi:hypothetical protein